MQCPKCGSERVGSPRYCGSCGEVLMKPCPLCRGHNSVSDIYCEHCGSKLEDIVLGFKLDDARAFNEQFAQRMGWWDDPEGIKFADGRSVYESLLEKENLPTYSASRTEFWLFSCRVVDEDWKIDRISINGQALGSGWGQKASTFLVPTRTRYMVFDLKNARMWQWLYKDIKTARAMGPDVSVAFDSGDVLVFHVKAKGPRLVDRVQVLGYATGIESLGDPMGAAIGQHNIGVAKSAQSDFLAVVRSFVDSTAAVRSWAGAPDDVVQP